MVTKVRIIDNSAQFIAAVELKESRLIKSAANFCKKRAKVYCPVLSGDLMNSIDAVVEKFHFLMGSPLLYAGFVELGTSKMSAQPYMRPAMLDTIAFLKTKT